MPNVLHIIDPSTPQDALEQLALLAGAQDEVVSIGPVARIVPACLGARPVHRPLGSARLAAWRLGGVAPEAYVVHAWSPAAARAARAAANARGCKLVVSLVAAPPEEDREAGPGAPGLKALRRRPRGATVTVPAEASRKALLDWGLPPECVAVLGPVAEAPADLDERRGRTREQLGLAAQDVLLVAPMEMVRHAGHKYASWVHGILRQMMPNVRLMLPGGGPVASHVEFFAKTTGYDAEVFLTADRFDRTDAIAAADIVMFLQHADCGVGALAAAMAAGRPVVACGTPDVAELVQHEQTGLLVPRRNPRVQTAAVLRLIEDPALARRLAEAAGRYAREHFARPDALRRLERIYISSE